MLSEVPGPVTLPALSRRLKLRNGAGVGSVHGRLELLALTGRVCKTELLGEIAWSTP
jgi:hypothetical protein